MRETKREREKDSKKDKMSIKYKMPENKINTIFKNLVLNF